MSSEILISILRHIELSLNSNWWVYRLTTAVQRLLSLRSQLFEIICIHECTLIVIKYSEEAEIDVSKAIPYRWCKIRVSKNIKHPSSFLETRIFLFSCSQLKGQLEISGQTLITRPTEETRNSFFPHLYQSELFTSFGNEKPRNWYFTLPTRNGVSTS